jgi:SAM-dependent methyltransferase
MSVAHLVLAQAPATELVDEMAPREPMVDHPASVAAEGTARERWGRAPTWSPRLAHHRSHWNDEHVWFGAGVGDDGEYRCAATSPPSASSSSASRPLPRRAIRTRSCSREPARRSIAIDASAETIDELRRRAEQAEVRVECHTGDLPDLGFATSGSVDLVVASHTIDGVDDVSALLRQVHRVLKPDAVFVAAMTHPWRRCSTPGIRARTQVRRDAVPIVERAVHGVRAHELHIEVMHEITPVTDRAAMAPSVLLLRARKVGV